MGQCHRCITQGNFKIVSVRRGKKMRGGTVLQMHNTRQPQDCVYGEGKEGERWDNVIEHN